MTDPNMIAKYFYDMIHFDFIYLNRLEILKVYKIIEKNKYYCIICDCFNHFNGKFYYNKQIYVYKSYICYQELIELLNNKRG